MANHYYLRLINEVKRYENENSEELYIVDAQIFKTHEYPESSFQVE